MKLKSLTVSNIMAYKDEKTFDFDNLTYIIGPNGSGKSTIVDLIYLAFFRRPWRTNQINSLLSNSSDAYISLEFLINQNHYKIERYISKSKKKSKQDVLYKNGELVVSGNQNVTEEVKLLLGDPKLWITLVPQRQLIDILDYQKFKQFYSIAFKLENLDIFYKAVNKLYNRSVHEESILDQQIKQYKDQNNALKFDKNRYFKLKHEIETLDKQIDFLLKQDLTSDRIQLEKQLNILKQQEEKLLSYLEIQKKTKHYLPLFESNLDSNKLQKASMLLAKGLTDKQIKTMFKLNYERLVNIKHKLQHMADTYDRYNHFKSDAKQLKEYLKLYNKYKPYPLSFLLQSDINKLYETLLDYAKDIIAFLANKFKLDINIDSTNKTITKQHIDALEKIMHLPDIDRYIKDLPVISYEEKQLLKNLKSWNDLNNLIQVTRKVAKQFRLSYLHTKAKKALSKLEHLYYDEAINVYESYEDFAFYKQVVEAIQDISKYVTSMSEWKSIMHRAIDKELQEVRDKIQSLEIQINDLDKQHKKIKNQISDLVAKKKALQEQLTKLEAVKAKKEQLSKLIINTQSQIDKVALQKEKMYELQCIFDTIVKALNTKFRQTFPMIVKSVIERFSFNFDIVIDDDFKLYVKISDDKQVTPNMLSGAQQSILALAIRYAFARLLDIRFPIILDEVTEGFDNSRIDILKGFINQLSKHNQTIVISHDARIISDNVGSIIQLS